MRTVNLRRSVHNILRRLSLRTKADRCRPGMQLSRLLNDERQVEALQTLQAHSQQISPVEKPKSLPVDASSKQDALTQEALSTALLNKQYDQVKFILERINHNNSQDRLILNLCRCITGERVSALLDLRDWHQSDSFNDDARTLYAWLLDEDGNHTEAMQVLDVNDIELSNTHSTLQSSLHAILLMQSGDIHEARQIARHHPENHAPMARLGLVESEGHESDLVMKLADEIILHESVLRSLVVGLRCDPVIDDIVLLIKAIRRAFNRLHNRGIAYESLGILHLLAGEHREARMWILRGIREFPRSSALLMLLLQLPNDYPLFTNTTMPHVGVPSRKRINEIPVISKDALPSNTNAYEPIPASVHVLNKEAA